MAKFEFTESDFKEFEQRLYPDNGCAEYIADKANARLKQMLEEAMTVYGFEHDYGSNWYEGKNNQNIKGTELTAKLVCIEELRSSAKKD